MVFQFSISLLPALMYPRLDSSLLLLLPFDTHFPPPHTTQSEWVPAPPSQSELKSCLKQCHHQEGENGERVFCSSAYCSKKDTEEKKKGFSFYFASNLPPPAFCGRWIDFNAPFLSKGNFKSQAKRCKFSTRGSFPIWSRCSCYCKGELLVLCTCTVHGKGEEEWAICKGFTKAVPAKCQFPYNEEEEEEEEQKRRCLDKILWHMRREGGRTLSLRKRLLKFFLESGKVGEERWRKTLGGAIWPPFPLPYLLRLENLHICIY